MNIFEDKSVAIFDLDGTLVNNEPLKGKALAETCRRHGGNSESDIYVDVLGCKYEIVRSYFRQNAQIDIDDVTFDTTLKEVYLNLLNKEVVLTEGAGDFLIKLKNKNLRTGLVSSALRWMVNSVLDRLSLRSVFDLTLSREDVQEHKPSPEAYLLALKKLGVDANDVIVFEDSLAGLTAAREAGCQVIAIRHLYNKGHDFSRAIGEIESFREIM